MEWAERHSQHHNKQKPAANCKEEWADRRRHQRKGEGGEGDEPGYTLNPEDLRLWEVYGDWVHANPGTYLDRGVRDNSECQVWWHDLAVMPSRRYDAPSGKFGCRFVGTLGEELKGVRDRRWNLEQFIVFQTVILQQACHITAS